jgi:phosphate transport system protein
MRENTMSIHLFRDLEALHRDILGMCAIVEEMIHKAVDGLKQPSEEAVRELTIQDDEIDQRDVRIEEECLKILALHHPVASDLRRTATVLKITGELERVADLSLHIAERACGLMAHKHIVVPDRMYEMVQLAVGMLHRSIDAFVDLDSQLARQVCTEDEAVDELNRDIIQELIAVMQQSPDLIEPAMHLFSAARHVERVADHATNIAEDVIYLSSGRIVRHRRDEADT